LETTAAKLDAGRRRPGASQFV